MFDGSSSHWAATTLGIQLLTAKGVEGVGFSVEDSPFLRFLLGRFSGNLGRHMCYILNSFKGVT